MWESINDLETAKSLIVNPQYRNTGNFDPIPTDVFDGLLKGRKLLVLDFGAGVGRNTKMLLQLGHEVSAYDFPNMRQLAKDFMGKEDFERVPYFTPPLSSLDGLAFNLIFASLVLQHISPDHLDAVLEKFSQLLLPGGRLCVFSRGYLDAGGSVWDHIGKHFQPVTPCNMMDATENHQSVIFEIKH